MTCIQYTGSGSMQSLGKVSNSRRMPAPVQLESLKSSHDDYGLDSVSLVPQGGGGWTNNTGGDKKEEDDKKKTKMEKKEGMNHVYSSVIISLDI